MKGIQTHNSYLNWPQIMVIIIELTLEGNLPTCYAPNIKQNYSVLNINLSFVIRHKLTRKFSDEPSYKSNKKMK